MTSRFRFPAAALLAALLLCLVALPAPLAAQEGPGIAILDMERILRESKAATTLREEVERQRLSHQEKLREQENALRTADEELARQRAVLSNDAFTAKRKELQDQALALQQEFVSRQQEMEELFGRGIGQVRSALAEVAKEIADEQGINLILLKATIVLASRELDITEEALRRLDEKLPSVDVSASGN